MSLFQLPYVDRPRVQVEFDEPSLTKQSFKDECDINNILKKYKRALGAEFLDQYQGFLDGKFEDVSAGVDYRTALHQISEADAAFEAMPAGLRARFDNDPGLLLDFLGDSRNRDEAIELGLLAKVHNDPVPTTEKT